VGGVLCRYRKVAKTLGGWRDWGENASDGALVLGVEGFNGQAQVICAHAMAEYENGPCLRAVS
jgi:hypothetical protein